ncbi:DUF551 domain-containing protein [Enterobacter hormaechei]|nr:DUF551 domain-containing protein [Enterobacter hormaechei]
MSNIDKHAVQAVADLKAGYTLGHADVAILNELARIALASLEAEPVCVIDQANLDYLNAGSDADVWPASRTEMGDVLLYRSAPPAPASVPDDFDFSRLAFEKWITENYDSRLMRSGTGYAGRVLNQMWQCWLACRAAMLQKVAVTPKSNDWRNYDATYDFSGKPDADLKDQPAYPETLPCPVLLEPGMKFGKGVQTEVMLKGLQRRAERNAELDAMTPEQRAEHDAGLQEFAAMLQGANCNSPVIPDGWIPVSERMPEEDGNYWGWWSESKRQGPVWFIKSDLQAQFQSSEITHWMPLPAAPQQEDIIC